MRQTCCKRWAIIKSIRVILLRRLAFLDALFEGRNFFPERQYFKFLVRKRKVVRNRLKWGHETYLSGFSSLVKPLEDLSPNPSPLALEDLSPNPSPLALEDLSPNPSPPALEDLSPNPSPPSGEGNETKTFKILVSFPS